MLLKGNYISGSLKYFGSVKSETELSLGLWDKIQNLILYLPL